jgi:hypothetical protein
MLQTDQKIWRQIRYYIGDIKREIKYQTRNIRFIAKYFFIWPTVIKTQNSLIRNIKCRESDTNRLNRNVKREVDILLHDAIIEAVRSKEDDIDDLIEKYDNELEWLKDHGQRKEDYDIDEAYEDHMNSMWGGPDYPYHLEEIEEHTKYLRERGFYV